MPASAERAPSYVLDSSAILAYLLNEPKASRVAALHSHASIPFIVPAELYAALWLKFGQAKADEAIAAIRQWQLPWLWPTEASVLLAGRWRAVYRLGLADSFIASLAFIHQATLVTKNSDFQHLKQEVKLLFL